MLHKKKNIVDWTGRPTSPREDNTLPTCVLQLLKSVKMNLFHCPWDQSCGDILFGCQKVVGFTLGQICLSFNSLRVIAPIHLRLRYVAIRLADVRVVSAQSCQCRLDNGGHKVRVASFKISNPALKLTTAYGAPLSPKVGGVVSCHPWSPSLRVTGT